MSYIDNINSATKYPSIKTYHELDGGVIKNELQASFEKEPEVLITEKIDGTNARIVFFSHEAMDLYGMAPPMATFIPRGTTIIGSRKDFLFASGDLVHNSALGIVDTLSPLSTTLALSNLFDYVYVFYGEVYGGKTSKAAKFYSAKGNLGFRLFDALQFRPKEFRDVVERPQENIATWREHGGQPFVSETRLQEFADVLGVEMAPRIKMFAPPTDASQTHEWLKETLSEGSKAILDEKGKGKPEGVVIRTPDRRRIAKIRFEDYEKYDRKRGK